ncbi:hypothetical protein GHI93_09935 [Lactococcus hircilactis]|uniref:Uncharacterized protein n=1 Tax=Lactococcus hircilactis TaxID=1494462 RepID=A0A7X1ZBW3_9LACT|nr:hypothetical protein [Lactococcus hircilactis]MQW40245.1 hypothetical protein [Lactococcus hircilactis]
MSWTDYFIHAAKKSQWDIELWMRYLNKAIQRDQNSLSSRDLEILLKSDVLTSFQKVFLELACEKGTTPWQMTVEMSEPSHFNHLNAIINELA